MKLWDWQKEAYKKLEEQDFRGVIKVASGKGKTVLALKVITTILERNKNAKALVVVPTINLLHQWTSEVKKFIPEFSCTHYFGETKNESGNIVIAVINSVAKLGLHEEYKIKVLDEVHHYGAELYQSIFSLRTEHTIGLSATPEREDEGDFAIRYGVGKIVYSLDIIDELLLRFSLINIRVSFTAEEYNTYIEHHTEYRKLLFFANIKAKDVQRLAKRGNKYALRILKIWSKLAQLRHNAEQKIPAIQEIVKKEKGEKIIIFSESIDFSERLGQEIGAIVVHSKISKKEVKKRLENFREKQGGILVAPRMIDEGYDVPSAHVAIIASFTRSGRQMIQRDGRILRENTAVRRYTLIIADVEEEKYFRILQNTQMVAIALHSTWLQFNKGLHKDPQVLNAFQEFLHHADDYNDWIKQKLDFYVMTEQMDYAFYERHKRAIQHIIEEDPKRWKLLQKHKPPTKLQFESRYNLQEQAKIKEELRQINSRVFLPEELFIALLRYIEGESFVLDTDDQELAIRLANQADPKMWTENVRKLLQDFSKKLSSQNNE